MQAVACRYSILVCFWIINLLITLYTCRLVVVVHSITSQIIPLYLLIPSSMSFFFPGFFLRFCSRPFPGNYRCLWLLCHEFRFVHQPYLGFLCALSFYCNFVFYFTNFPLLYVLLAVLNFISSFYLYLSRYHSVGNELSN